MERQQILATMGELKLFGMKAAYDEIIKVASSAATNRSRSSATCYRPRSARSRRARSATR